MKVRKITGDGDYQLGRGSLIFFQDTAEGVAQNVSTRLQLWRGTWFINTQSGTPWLQEILGKHEAVDVVLRNRILETPGVISLEKFESILDPNTRRLTVEATVNTEFGTAEVMETI